jgi:hypothetical protein
MDNEGKPVVITDIKIPFLSLMGFMTKLVLAGIPAILIASVIIGGLLFGLKFGLGMLGMNLPFQIPFIQ